MTLALGIGANTAMFQLLDAVQWRTLPVERPDELVEIRLEDMTHARGSWLRESSLTNPIGERLRGDHEAFATLGAGADEPLERTVGFMAGVATTAVLVSGSIPLLHVMRAEPGRALTLGRQSVLPGDPAWLRQTLLSSQMAFSLALLAAG